MPKIRQPKGLPLNDLSAGIYWAKVAGGVFVRTASVIWRELGPETAAQFGSLPPFIMQQFAWSQPAPGDAEPPPLLTANVESCFSSFSVWHFGHSGVCAPKRMASNLCPHDWQRYSKIGMNDSASELLLPRGCGGVKPEVTSLKLL